MELIQIDEGVNHIELVAALAQRRLGLSDQVFDWTGKTTTPAGGVIRGRSSAVLAARIAIPMLRVNCSLVMDCQVAYRDGRWGEGLVIAQFVGDRLILGPAIFGCRRVMEGVARIRIRLV